MVTRRVENCTPSTLKNRAESPGRSTSSYRDATIDIFAEEGEFVTKIAA
jgi:hypothetical protein